MFQKVTNYATGFLQKLEHNVTHKEGSDGWSHICGGLGGHPFEFVNTNYQLVGVKGKAANYVNQLQFLFRDAHTGQFQTTPAVGKPMGHDFVVECPPGQWISKVHVFSGSVIDALQFETNSGMKTAKFGGQGGKEYVVETKGKKICGVKGKVSNHIEQLCFGISH